MVGRANFRQIIEHWARELAKKQDMDWETITLSDRDGFTIHALDMSGNETLWHNARARWKRSRKWQAKP